MSSALPRLGIIAVLLILPLVTAAQGSLQKSSKAGYTKEQFLEFLEVFNFSAREFQQFLIENDKGE